jgi:hypothetical protein
MLNARNSYSYIAAKADDSLVHEGNKTNYRSSACSHWLSFEVNMRRSDVGRGLENITPSDECWCPATTLRQISLLAFNATKKNN